ncbi:MAG: hypothetical protein ACI4ML_04735 [Aristaeellaceae bacterium]
MRKMLTWLLLMAMLLLPCTGLAQELTVISMAGYDDSSANHDWNTNLFFQRMEERTGIAFMFSQYTDENTWAQAKQSMIDGVGELPEVLFKASLSNTEQMEMYNKGVLIDLKPYLEEHAPNLWAMLQENPDWLRAITLPDGAIVALPGINQLQNNNAMWINTAWLNSLGLSVPTTAQELTEVLRAFKTQDPNRNGKQDEIPLSFCSLWDLRFLGHAFGLVANDYYVTMDEGGQVKSILTTEENRAFLTWLHELWTEGLISQDGFTTIDSTRRITDSSATMTYGMFFSPTPLNLIPSSALDQYAMLEPLTWEGRQVYRDLTGDVITGTFAITSACPDPVAMVEWVDYLYTEEGSRLAQGGAEDEEYAWNSDGTWSWIYDTETMANGLLAEATIADGASMPGLASVEFQLSYDDTVTHTVIEELLSLKAVARLPYPQVFLTEEKQARVDAIQADLGYYAEQQMVWFVTGDVELNDDTWNDFCRTLEQKGMEEMLAIWREAAQ